MDAATEDRKLASVKDPDDETPDTPETPDDEAAINDPTSDEAAAEAEEQAEKERKKAAEAAAEQLSFPVGGVRPTKALIQITGGEVEIPPHLLPDKDEEFELVVSGWVKTHKTTTEKKGGVASRTAVFVVEDVDLQRLSS